MATEYYKRQATTVLPATVVNVTTLQTTGNVACGQFKYATLSQTITAIGGTTPSMACQLYGSVDGVTFWPITAGLIPAATANGFQRITSIDISGFQSLQYQYTLSGTAPTATMRLDIQLTQ